MFKVEVNLLIVQKQQQIQWIRVIVILGHGRKREIYILEDVATSSFHGRNMNLQSSKKHIMQYCSCWCKMMHMHTETKVKII